MSDRPTKERILDAAEEIMLERSFHSVGLNQILAAVKVPKGSFYHYFESKEQFGVEMLRHYGNGAAAWKRQMLLDSETQPDPLQRLVTFFTCLIGKVQENGGKCPCLIQKLASEVADFSEPMRDELAKSSRTRFLFSPREWSALDEDLRADRRCQVIRYVFDPDDLQRAARECAWNTRSA